MKYEYLLKNKGSYYYTANTDFALYAILEQTSTMLYNTA